MPSLAVIDVDAVYIAYDLMLSCTSRDRKLMKHRISSALIVNRSSRVGHDATNGNGNANNATAIDGFRADYPAEQDNADCLAVAYHSARHRPGSSDYIELRNVDQYGTAAALEYVSACGTQRAIST